MPNRRNAELFLLGFAALITMWRCSSSRPTRSRLALGLVQYLVFYVALFAGAHLAIRRFAPTPIRCSFRSSRC